MKYLSKQFRIYDVLSLVAAVGKSKIENFIQSIMFNVCELVV